VRRSHPLSAAGRQAPGSWRAESRP
jgi:hypothetical protein